MEERIENIETTTTTRERKLETGRERETEKNQTTVLTSNFSVLLFNT